jgi:hypothetical protein
MLVTADGSYLDQLTFDPRMFGANGITLVQAMTHFVDNGFSGVVRMLLFGALAALALAGYVRCLRNGCTARELFVPLYFVLIVIWPASAWDQRFLLPLLPFFFLYALHGIVLFREMPRPVALTAAAPPALVLASYVAHYSRLDFGPQREGITTAASSEFFDYVRQSTERDDVFIFQKPRAFALMTERRAAAHHTPRSDDEFWRYLGEVRATHLVVCRVFRESAAVLQPFVERHRERLREEFHNADFIVYRIETRTGTETASLE